MSLTKNEKAYLKEVVKKELEHFAREKKTLLTNLPPQFLKGEHDYQHFLENLLKKLD